MTPGERAQISPISAGRVGGDESGGLGEAVALADRDPGDAAAELALHLGGQRAAA
jgi:hypothetical protein